MPFLNRRDKILGHLTNKHYLLTPAIVLFGLKLNNVSENITIIKLLDKMRALVDRQTTSICWGCAKETNLFYLCNDFYP